MTDPRLVRQHYLQPQPLVSSSLLLLALLSHRALYRTFARKRETGHHASVLASVAGRTTGSASSLIGCHDLQWGGLLGLYPYYWPFLCHKDDYSNAAITVHPTSRLFMQHHKM